MRLFLLLFFSLFTILPLFGQVVFENLDQCLEHVKKNNPGLKAAHLDRAISEERLRAARARLLPQVKAFTSFDNNISLPVQLVPAEFLGGEEGEFATVQFGTQYAMSFGAEASMPLVDVAQWKNVQSSALGREVSVQNLKHHELDLLDQAAMAYYSLLLSQEAGKLNREIFLSADTLLQTASVRLQNGMIEPLEYNRVKAVWLESLQQWNESLASVKNRMERLRTICGISGPDSILIVEDLHPVVTEVPLEPTGLSINFRHVPRYTMAVQQQRLREVEWQQSRAQVIPQISMFARYSRQSFGEQLNLFPSEVPWFDIGVVGLRAEWILFSGLGRQASIRQGSLRLQASGFELEKTQMQVDQELLSLQRNHTVAMKGVKHYAEHFTLNSANYSLAGLKYREGVYTIDQYLKIYQEMVLSQNLYLGKLADFLVYDAMVNLRNRLQ